MASSEKLLASIMAPGSAMPCRTSGSRRQLAEGRASDVGRRYPYRKITIEQPDTPADAISDPERLVLLTWTAD